MADYKALNKILTRELNDFLYPKNNFIFANGMQDKQGENKHVVEVNESQEQPTIQENPTVWPLPIHSTEDKVKSYTIDTIVSHPTIVNHVDELLTVFDKRANELKKHAKALETQYTDKIAHAWALDVAVGAAIVETTGSAAAVLNGNMTGTRKQMTRADWVKAISTLAKQEVPTDGLVALVDEAMYWNIYELDEFIRYDATGKVDPVRGGGAIGELLGVRIFKRNGVITYDKNLTQKNSYLNADGTRRKAAADDNLSVMMWHPAFVRYSFGAEKTYLNVDDATTQADILSARLRCGAMRSRLDDKGVVMIVQDWVS